MKLIPFFIAALLISFPAYSEFGYWALKSVKEIYLDDERFPNWPSSTEIEFTNGHIAKTKVIEFKFVSFLHPPSDQTFIIFTGRTCKECDMSTSIYIQAVDKSEYYRKRFGYPGKIKSYLNGELIDITRMFYGHCLKIGGQTVIFYSEYLGSDNKWHKGVYDVDFDGKNTIQNPAVIPYDTIKETEALVKKGRC